MASQVFIDSQQSKSSSVRESEGLDESWSESVDQSQGANKFRKCSENYIVGLVQLLSLFR